VIDEDEEGEKIRKKSVDGEVLHLIIPRGEIDVEFAKNAKKKKGKFCFHPLNCLSTLKPWLCLI
jgi:hypothetical protein